MSQKWILYILVFILPGVYNAYANNDTLRTKYSSQEFHKKTGWFSLGIRSTLNVFSDDGFGMGVGGQFRLQLSDRVNTDWFADYISVNQDDIARSEYLHIGWSVLFYPVKKWQYPVYKVQPFLLAGHCFDYNKKTIISEPGISKHRWGAAVQIGAGSHIHFSERLDLTFMLQYMLHLTKELDVEIKDATYEVVVNKGSALEGHLLCTASINYKIARLWKK